ncbi:protein kinase domain containing protein [Grosmannia clavigera kw1407]|uniref:Protein kinase domain containing protein n=1 Tax=Grosmannia clavigera (strain kw1407 / UAMH 11150) TaxID=655863 RepID=F0X730_GROCL|nr:protein kinase domain containing protein [Grosmannia clavigera kw1407]EFX06507.1 protein kinase domain containing protein [Grosmannia clavigera kw1407]
MSLNHDISSDLHLAISETFMEKQWAVLVPNFDDDVRVLELDMKQPLPFTHVEMEKASGGFSTVHKVVVHKEFRKYKTCKDTRNTGEIALKEIVFENGGFDKEVSANIEIRNIRHKNIVEYIGAIHRGNNYYLCFIWANGHDLGTYWNATRTPHLSSDSVESAIRQVRGLMDGLDSLHHISVDHHFRHTDIKPANILRFVRDPGRDSESIGTLKLSDFGLARRHTEATEKRNGTTAQAATTRYWPPEAKYRSDKTGLTRRYDVWSMGCVGIELVIWLLRGTKGLDQFNRSLVKDQYFEKSTTSQAADRIEVHYNVSNIITTILKDPGFQGRTAIGDFLQLIQDKMLVVNINQNLGSNLEVPNSGLVSASSKVRATAAELVKDLDLILQGHGGSNYWFTGKIRTPSPAPGPTPKIKPPTLTVTVDDYDLHGLHPNADTSHDSGRRGQTHHGPGGDFEQEAQKMEDVFSLAYCVLAACSARGQSDGMFSPRPERHVVMLAQINKVPIYVCNFIDNFQHDVLQSNLSGRGWVLQERALARRTVYFSQTQLYWECGDGIKLYEGLYRQYSRLQFTHATDRPVAIAGLQQRLIRDLDAVGGFGIFDDGRSLLQHSLLWQRGHEIRTLTRIDFGSGRAMPSWSWMAYHEGIDYIDLPLGNVEWLQSEVYSPWANSGALVWNTEFAKSSLEIGIRVREFRVDFNVNVNANTTPAEVAQANIVYDAPDPSRTSTGTILCVLMGKLRKGSTAGKQSTYCVLLVQSRGSRVRMGDQTYERVGVGLLSGMLIDLKSPGILARLR